jgi:hypothetical protein
MTLQGWRWDKARRLEDADRCVCGGRGSDCRSEESGLVNRPDELGGVGGRRQSAVCWGGGRGNRV